MNAGRVLTIIPCLSIRDVTCRHPSSYDADAMPQIYDSEYPSYTWTRHDPNDENCPVVNVTPSDLPTETEVESPAGTPYFMQDSSGRILSAQGSYSLGGVVFGSQPDPNSWDDCLQRCLSFCDADPNCKSFNIFTFEESDYANCQVTCECRAATRFYDASDYSVSKNNISSKYHLTVESKHGIQSLLARFGPPRTQMPTILPQTVNSIPRQPSLTLACGKLPTYLGGSEL